jgi:hypothetical protein
MAEEMMSDRTWRASWPALLRGDLAVGILSALFVLVAVLLALSQFRYPQAAPANAPPASFSSARAMSHLQVIAKAPRPIGSLAEAEARDYIVKELGALGLNPEVQTTTVINQKWGSPFRAGTVHNILARLPGAEGGNNKALLLAGHYDTVPTSFGASDDGSAVVSMLEIARAIKAGSPLKRDVIFLFTDGEEVGLLGAQAFVEAHPWAKDVGLVVNLEARGNSGPSLMFETSGGNGRLVRELAKADDRPATSSALYEIYRALPNETDFTIFKDAGLPGLNLAYVGGLTHYHDALDSIARIDEGSLQHQGASVLALTRVLGNEDLANPVGGNAVYFSVAGSPLIRYPASWALLFSVVVLALFVAVVVLGFKKDRLSFSGIVRGFFALLLSMACATILVSIISVLIILLHSGYRSILQGTTYNRDFYVASFVAFALAVTAAIYVRFRRKASVENLMVGGLLWWVILMLFSSLLLPGISYLFTWPLLFTLIAMAYLFTAKEEPGAHKKLAAYLFGALPGILLLTPIIYLSFVAFRMIGYGMVMILVVLLIAPLLPALSLMTRTGRWLLPASALALALVLIVGGSLTSGFDENHPKPNDLFYALNADTGNAVWASADVKPDEWTTQYLSANPEKDVLAHFFPLSSRKYLIGPAPAVSLAAPTITLLNDETNKGVRHLRLRVASSRKAPVLSVQVETEAEVVGDMVNDKRIDYSQVRTPGEYGDRWGVNYYGVPDEGVELTVFVKSTRPVKLRVVDQSYGLPEHDIPSFQARPNHMMPAPVPFTSYSDVTMVSKSFTF